VAATDIYLVDQTEIERIERWRADELERAGFQPRAAGRLAVRHDVDLHTATDLLERGCPQDLALKILL
jgi:succinylglutamate desuccinylase